MTNEEREKHIRIANMLIGVINDLEIPMLMTQTEKDVTREALENYIKMLEQQPCEDAEEYGMNEQMQFPETFEGFAKEYGFKDDKEVYTNGSDLIPIFRVKQWLEQDNKLRAIETDTAYECGKHANRWILVSERLPEIHQDVLLSLRSLDIEVGFRAVTERYFCCHSADGAHYIEPQNVLAWQPLPEPYRAESEE